MNFVVEYSYLIPLLPLLAAAVSGFAGAKLLKGQSHLPIWLGVGASAALAIVLLVGMLGASHGVGPVGAEATGAAGDVASLGQPSHWFNWIDVGAFHASFGAWIDPLTAVMLTVVCGIGFLITVFSAGYMKGEAGYFRFFAYLGLFIFAMCSLVMADNLILLYLGWEGVGLCSYLLIGYYYDKPAAREAAKKAFIVNRIGDFGFMVGILMIFYAFGTVSYFGTGAGSHTGFVEMALNPDQYVPAARQWVLAWIPFCLMLGAFGKSAQFPLYVWLPDAMEGPTPVSALIHAATMVTAGVYMIVRLGTLFVGHPFAMTTLAVVGAFTALFAALIALRQTDLKKVFAYSTVSQLGYMFVGVAVLAPVAGVFHLVTHAFFKALLFLCAGVVMHAMHGELDLRKMSGLKTRLPKTRLLVLCGCLALAGFPLFAGFWSKDEIVAGAGSVSVILNLVLLLTSLLTAYYTFRLYFRVFEGPEVIPAGGAHGHDAEELAHANDPHAHNPEPLLMILPLAILALGAVFAGVINLPFGGAALGHRLGHFLGQSPSLQMSYQQAAASYGSATAASEGVGVDPVGFGQAGQETAFHLLPLLIGGVVSLLGIGLAYVLHLKDRARADALAGTLRPLAHASDRKFWIDQVYAGLVVMPLRLLGRVLDAIDRFIIDGLVFLAAFVPQVTGFTIKIATQRGYLQGYAVGIMFGLAIILLVMFL